MSKILTQAQAEAVYSAMCALNNVGGSNRHIDIPGNGGENIAIVAKTDGQVAVWLECRGLAHRAEDYADQSAFAAAYGLSQG